MLRTVSYATLPSLVPMTLNIPTSFRDPNLVRTFIEKCLANNPKRVAHVLEISRRVRETAEKLGLRGAQLELAECAALLHDIGYWEPIAKTGFHPIDGARFLEEHQEPELAAYIIGHSCSPEEGELSGFPGIRQDPSLIAKLITYWDVQVKQGGEVVSYSERFADIISRYGEACIVGKANVLAKPRIEQLIREIDDQLC